jgi:hypothetical protein
MYHLFFYIFIGCLNVFYNDGFRTSSNSELWLITATSSLSVDGKTNINTFKCDVSSYGKTDTLNVDLRRGGNSFFKIKSILDIPVSNFDCHHKIMTKDLQKTLKMSQHPLMFIDIKSLDKLPEDAIQFGSVGDIHISLAGTKVKYQLQFKAKKHQNHLELIGKRHIHFSDFGLIPPSKLGGTIKVKDQLDVEVRLHLRKIS